jgi:hypothetical protein
MSWRRLDARVRSVQCRRGGPDARASAELFDDERPVVERGGVEVCSGVQ